MELIHTNFNVSALPCSPWLIGIATSMVAFKLWNRMTMGKCRSFAQLTNKTAIVTGASAGVGLETAKDFAKRGARVVMVCRDMKKAERVKNKIVAETGNKNIALKQIDFESLSSVRKCANEILQEEKRINILLNNAGIISDCFIKTDDGLDTLMQTNHFGPFLFTNILLGRIKESAPSRIANVASDMHAMAKLDLNKLDLSNIANTDIAYGNSKLCNILMANELADKLKGTGVTVNSCTPGVVLTEIMRKSPSWFTLPWGILCKIFFKNPKEGAQTSIHVCVSPELENVTGKYFKDCKIKDVSKVAKDREFGKKLWELSEKAVKLQPKERHY